MRYPGADRPLAGWFGSGTGGCACVGPTPDKVPTDKAATTVTTTADTFFTQ
ncbi:hypothetical protein HUN08_16515 [Gordonia sp. X0973]|uniref:hypothetical protein n=1 Tax=Gordonia sp. X0973 TaxID=2742602 RepID=UPI0013E9D9D0|nr:hypothetical protein [Gordonia sp. X0973]QKT08628.1 hypothetical protein HUN08_16515 [Gordonia sp. X0973]